MKTINTWVTLTRQLRLALGLLTASVMASSLTGCGGGEDSLALSVTDADGNPAAIQINTPAQIAQESADDYDDNLNGLITGATLKRWKDDWLNERPAGITGNLVILQAWEGAAGSEYIAPNGMNVFTYLVDRSEWVQTRSNGVIHTRSMVPDGATVDALLAEYDIDPSRDMIVCAQGTGGNYQAMLQGRCWYMFRYWGVAKEHLALLNGSNDWQVTNGSMTAGDFTATATDAPGTGTASVRELPQDNTALQATLQDMIEAVTSIDQNNLGDGVFIWDARNAGQFDGTGSFQNGGSRQGHPNGALLLDYSNLLVSTEGHRYKDKADLQNYLDGNTDVGGNGFVDAIGPVGAGNAYQTGDTIYTYCETTFRAMVTGVASSAILGLPTRFYDGAMYEWHSMSNIVAADGYPILPADSPWRTDKTSRAFWMEAAGGPTAIATRSIDDAYAANAQAIITADKNYKRNGSTDEDDGESGSGGLPTNPCGG